MCATDRSADLRGRFKRLNVKCSRIVPSTSRSDRKMCGIAGIVDTTRTTSAESGESLVRRMANTLAHRGPDDLGVWGLPEAGVFFGHRRLAVQDLTLTGRQPMATPDGRWTIAFNGEVYNFLHLRKELQQAGASFRGHSDTEVLLELVSRVGVAQALRRAIGMFALALWDSQERTLYIARDRLGEKPLYYGWLDNSFVFSSELRALFEHPSWVGEIDRASLTAYLRYGCVPAPMSIFSDVKKLEPGELLTLEAAQKRLTTERYWDAEAALRSGQDAAWDGTEDGFLQQLDATLKSVVEDQMISDVPLGAFLSGGIDSSLVVALMQSQSARPVRTFTVGFDSSQYDESRFARDIAAYLGTDHTEARLSGSDALELVPAIPDCYDEPFADSSQLPTMLVSEVARKHVSVSLSGDGGDELFGGYSRYPRVAEQWEQLQRTPALLRQLGTTVGNLLPDAALAAVGRGGRIAWRRDLPDVGLAHRVRHRIRSWAPNDIASQYLRAVSFWDNPSEVVVRGGEQFLLETSLSRSDFAASDPLLWMRYRDSRIYLPDDILTKVDRAAMRVSLETRVPFLDLRVVELAWKASTEICFFDGKGKWPLRELLSRYIPLELFNRPKMGFAVPLGDWLRGPLREWAERLLEPKRIKREGWFNQEQINLRWNDLQAGGDGHDLALWSVLMFQAWKDRWSHAVRSA